MTRKEFSRAKQVTMIIPEAGSNLGTSGEKLKYKEV